MAKQLAQPIAQQIDSQIDPQIATHRIAVDGALLECRTVMGAASLPWLVFLHEGLGSVAMWRDYPERLCAALGMNGLIYSRQGYGRSSPLQAARPVHFMEHEAHHVLPQVLAHFAVTQPLLFGHSDGASIALLYAAHRPHALRGAIVLAPHVFVEAMAIDAIAKTRREYLEGDLRARLARYHDDVDGAFFGWNDVWLSAGFRTWDMTQALSDIVCPVLAIQGTLDEYGSMAQIDTLMARIAQVRDLRLPDCRHAPHKDQPAAVLKTLIDWLSQAPDKR